MKTNIALLAVAVAIQGCSAGAPSQTEIETAVTNAFTGAQHQQCDRIVIENIKKTNGVKVDDSTYQVMATYDVRVVPVGHKGEVDALVEKSKGFEEMHKQLALQITQVAKEEGDSRPNPQWIGVHPEAASERMRPLVDQYNAVGDQWQDSRIEVEKKINEVRKEWGSDYCRMIIGAEFGTGIFGFNDTLAAITEGGVNSFERTFNMTKTDNGWMELE